MELTPRLRQVMEDEMSRHCGLLGLGLAAEDSPSPWDYDMLVGLFGTLCGKQRTYHCCLCVMVVSWEQWNI